MEPTHNLSACASTEEVQRLISQSQAQLRADTQQSLRLAREAAAMAERLDDPHLIGLSTRMVANALGVLGNSQTSIELHRRAIVIFEDIGDDIELARTLSATVQPLILLGRYEEALEGAGHARTLFARHGDQMRLARLDINIGNILHRQDRFEEALAYYERAEATLVPIGDDEGIISAIHNKAVTLTALNDFHRALAAYEEARRLSVERDRTQSVMQLDYNIAWLYYLRGEYSRAIDMLHAAAQASTALGDAYHAALSLLDLSEIYLELNLSRDAREMAGQAHGRFIELGMGYEAAKALTNQAIALGQEGETARALALFETARAGMVKEQNNVWPSLIDVYKAILLLGKGRLYEARVLCTSALHCFDSAAWSSKAAVCHLLLARIALQVDDLGLARGHCDEALQRLGDRGTPMLIYHARLLIGHVAAGLGDRPAATHAYQAAREVLETLRNRLRGEELRISFVKNRLEVYERLIALHLEGVPLDDGIERAFEQIERAKSRTLLDLIFQPVHGFVRPPDSESPVSRSIREVREQLNWYYHLAEFEQLRPPQPSPRRLAQLQREIGTREQEIARLLREVEPAGSTPADFAEEHIAPISAIRAALPEGAALVEYFQIDERILACVLDAETLTISDVSRHARVAEHIHMLQFQLSKFRLGQAYVGRFQDTLIQSTQSHLAGLFNELLAPMWPRLRGRHLVIVPHGLLHYVPFHALFDGEHYVIDAGTLSYAPSASIFAQCQSQGRPATGPPVVLGVGDSRAPLIEDEAQAVADALPGARLFLGEDATLESLTRHGASSRVVHLATHGCFRPDSPMFSAIRLGDSYLNVYDLYGLRLRAELVTLSGCATGATVAAAGDELLGIARGLFAAGAQSLLLSLWNVNDDSTAALMTTFYERVAGGAPSARALRDAMIAIRDQRPHPYHWAPFVLTGRCAA
jgi:CHAT domain-containing protein/tetratricopeptide (TPR) repeat protein